MNKPTRIRIAEVGDIDLRNEPLAGIWAATRTLSSRRRMKVVRIVARRLREPAAMHNEQLRIELVRLLLALTPESWHTIRHIIQQESKSKPAVAEVQFSLFCFLPDLLAVSSARSTVSDVPSLVQDYLLRARSDRALATWMAGHLMGGHWPKGEAQRVLLNAVRNARHVAGRIAALHGLTDLMIRLSAAQRRKVGVQLEIVAKDDRSEKVRIVAAALAIEYRASVG